MYYYESIARKHHPTKGGLLIAWSGLARQLAICILQGRSGGAVRAGVGGSACYQVTPGRT